MKDIKEIIAENIVTLRKEHDMTQNELAKKLMYSDNTISRWEHAEITPSVESLVQISELFNIPIESLLKEKAVEQKPVESEKTRSSRILMGISTSIVCASLVWLIFIMMYVFCKSFKMTNPWILFVWAVPATCVALFPFRFTWKSRVYSFVIETICLWSTLASLFLQFLSSTSWLVFLIGIPIQIALSVLAFVRPKKKKNVDTKKEDIEKIQNVEEEQKEVEK